MKTLAPIPDFWREGLTIDGVPDIHVHTNAVYRPKAVNPDPNVGIYTQTGHLVQEAALYWHLPPQRIGHQDWIGHDAHSHLPTIDEAIYLGHTDLNFGHTITEFMPRLWALAALQRPGMKLLFHSCHPVDTLLATTWFREMVHSFGIDLADLAKFDEPVRVKRLIVPGPAFCENAFVLSAFNQHARAIGDKIVAASNRRSRELIYISRERNPMADRRYKSEEVVTQILRARGFRIVYPEETSFPDQVASFQRGNVIAGTLGSSLHTGIFGRGAKVVSISRDAPSSNFHLLDRFGENQVEYFRIVRPATEIERDEFRFFEPEESAAEIYEFCRARAGL